ncbi:MAG TPA: FMN-binding glutamate synthase family protein [Firmicutes bacterium]|jgi:methylamine---glutamate N-methyltransferase subunit C|nr:FMN-binding glutamate synthase family protein [Bacillota bacterium]
MHFGTELYLATGLSFLGLGILGLLLWKPAFNVWMDAFVKRLLKDPYPENIGEMYNVFHKVGVQNVLETDLRGASGEVLQRPFGTPRRYSEWDRLLLNPVYLSRKPVPESLEIETKVTIGPQAKRPLEIDIPLMIAGMAYGIGLSLNAKLALVKGANQEKTAVNSGAGPYLPEERKHGDRLIIQYHRGSWGKNEEWLRQANAVEIQLGTGALSSAPVYIKPQDLSPELQSYMHLGRDEGLSFNAAFDNVKSGPELTKLVNYLRQITNGVPIGVKIGATHLLEAELQIITAAGIDFLTIDGKEAGTYFGPGILEDDVGLPTLPALCRTVTFLKNAKLKSKISLIVSGGLVTPGQVLKALVLGADAVYLGTAVLIALAHNQIAKVIPWEPITELIYERGKFKDRLIVDQAARSVANFLKSCNQEIILAMRCLGKTSLKQLTIEDLSALTPEISKMTGAELALFSPTR